MKWKSPRARFGEGQSLLIRLRWNWVLVGCSRPLSFVGSASVTRRRQSPSLLQRPNGAKKRTNDYPAFISLKRAKNMLTTVGFEPLCKC